LALYFLAIKPNSHHTAYRRTHIKWLVASQQLVQARELLTGDGILAILLLKNLQNASLASETFLLRHVYTVTPLPAGYLANRRPIEKFTDQLVFPFLFFGKNFFKKNFKGARAVFHV